MITQSELKALLSYDPLTGLFHWLHTKSGVKRRLAGTIGSRYTYITIFGIVYPASNLAWLYTYGVFPEFMVDHIDRNKTNDAIENLREATTSENAQNRPVASNNRLGVKGVRYCPKNTLNPYRATLKIMGHSISRSFPSLDEAIKWRKEKVSLLHPYSTD